MEMVRRPVELSKYTICFYKNCLVFKHRFSDLKIILSNRYYEYLIEMEDGLLTYIDGVDFWIKSLENLDISILDLEKMILFNPCVDMITYYGKSVYKQSKDVMPTNTTMQKWMKVIQERERNEKNKKK